MPSLWLASLRRQSSSLPQGTFTTDLVPHLPRHAGSLTPTGPLVSLLQLLATEPCSRPWTVGLMFVPACGQCHQALTFTTVKLCCTD